MLELFHPMAGETEPVHLTSFICFLLSKTSNQSLTYWPLRAAEHWLASLAIRQREQKSKQDFIRRPMPQPSGTRAVQGSCLLTPRMIMGSRGKTNLLFQLGTGRQDSGFQSLTHGVTAAKSFFSMIHLWKVL